MHEAMAQSELGAAMPLSGGRPLMMLTDDEMYQIEQCRKIISLRDDILAGTHPRIKVPPHLAAKVNGTSAASSDGTPSRGEPSTSLQSLESLPQLRATNSSSFASNPQQPPVARPSSTAAAISKTIPPFQANGAKLFGSTATEIDPILLEKSESLIKAEINLQRQKIEKALREQVEQQPRRPKGHFHDAEVSERGLDVSDILSKAQELVQTASVAAPGATSQANNSAASDSFDEATYYSSRHDTPQLLSSPRLGNEPIDSQMADIPSKAPPAQDLVPGLRQPLANLPGLGLLQPPNQTQALPNYHSAPALISPAAYYSEPRETQAPSAMGLPSIPSQVSNRPEIAPEDSSVSVGNTGPNLNTSEESGEASRSEESGNERAAVQLIPGLTHQQAPPRAPVVRAHQLPLVAPQPAHVSPLAVVHRPTIVEEPDTAVSVVPPSQVAALRGEPGATSPESSPHGLAKRKTKKKKKKQEKSERQAVFTPALIKAEPRSTSPLTVPTFTRPAKRARQNRSGNNSVNLDQAAREQLVSVAATQRHLSGTYGELRDPRDHGGYERRDEVYARPPSGMVIHPESRYDQGYVTEMRPPAPGEYARPAQFAGPYSTAYVPAAGQPSRPVSQVIVDRGYREQPRFYTEDQGLAAPVRVRPEADRDRSRSPMPRERQPSTMGPQRAVSTVVVDAYGREYIEPSIMRQSAAPMLLQSEPEVIYERAPMRAASARAGRDIYDADGVIYRRASPTFGAPRRVITQPDYAVPEYRSYRQRDYADHPIPQPIPQHPQAGDEYVQIRHGAAERMVAQELPREYAQRAASVRPVETIRYEVPRGYSRVQSVRPEGPPLRDYAPNMQQDGRGRMAQPQPRPLPQDYGAPPAHPHVVRREYAGQPLEPYYENLPARPSENVTYIDRPPPPASIVYMDEQGREVYR